MKGRTLGTERLLLGWLQRIGVKGCDVYKPASFLPASFLIVALLLALSPIYAQQPATNNGQSVASTSAPTAPIAPYAENGGSTGVGVLSPAGGQGLLVVQADTHVLSGAEMLGLGFLRAPQSFFDPMLSITQGADTGIVPGVVDSTTTVGGGFALDEQWARLHLITLYNGSRSFYHPNAPLPGSSQRLSFAPTLTFGRWVVRLRDDLTLAPQGGFNGLGLEGAALAGDAALTNVTPLLEPGDDVLTAWIERLDNTSFGEVDYSLSRRATMTFVGSDTELHFLHSGYIDSDNPHGRAGYTYLLTPRDSIGLVYDYSLMRFSGYSSQTQTHLAQFSFAHTLVGRWAFQLSAGPQFVRLEDFGPLSGNQWSWSLTSSLTYQTHHANYLLTYVRGVTSGAGVIIGAETNVATVTVSRTLSRYWLGILNAGYAQNQPLVGAGQFTDWFAGANLIAPMGRHFRAVLNYSYLQQTNTGVCIVANCGLTMGRNIGNVRLEWHPLGIPRE